MSFDLSSFTSKIALKASEILGGKEKSISDLSWKAGQVAVASLVVYHFYLKTCDEGRKYLKPVKKAESLTWIDEASFNVFVAIVDALLPSLSVHECNPDLVRSVIANIDENLLIDANSSMTVDEVMKNKAYFLQGALDFGTHNHSANTLQNLVSKDELNKLSVVLKLLNTSIGTFLVTGYPVPFSKLPLWAREKALQGLRDSSVTDLRGLFSAFKRLVGVCYLSYSERSGLENPAWKALGYDPSPSVAKNFTTEEEKDNKLLKKAISYRYAYEQLGGHTVGGTDIIDVDVVIVGSGCGGGVMAGELVVAGFNVLVLEKGGYFQPPEFAAWREAEAMANLYDRGGLATSSDGSIIVLSGSCLGGGSTLNWLASFRTPDYVLADWEITGLKQFSKGGEFEQSLNHISDKFSVNTNNSHYEASEEGKGCNTFKVNENNRILWKGAECGGHTPERIPRNAKKCVDCGSCCFGCSHKSKQTALSVVFEPIMLAQVKSEKEPTENADKKNRKQGKLYIIPDCKALDITTAVNSRAGKKVATGVNAIVSVYEPYLGATAKRNLLATRKLQVRSKVTVSSCGSVWTPALLLNSGFKHRKIGKYLTLHPVLGCGGLFPKDVDIGLHKGVSMGVVVKGKDQIGNDPMNKISMKYLTSDDIINAKTHRVAIETPPAHLAIFGLFLPWDNGLSMKIMSLQHKNVSIFIGISRDHCVESHCITLDSEGNPVMNYKITKQDEKMILIGLERQIRLMYAAGAGFIFLAHSTYPLFYCNQKDADKKLDEYIDGIWKEGVQPHRMTVFSAHEMSSCRMASNSEDGPTSPTGELYECDNLFIADGSVLPTSLGINPMMTIEGFSHMISKNVIARLRSL